MPANNLVNDVLAVLQPWAANLQISVPTDGTFVFGSLIRDNGFQFSGTSDIDLLVVIPDAVKGPWPRAKWLRDLHEKVAELESALLRAMKWEDASKQITSVVAATRAEIEADIHKQGAAEFFAKNEFFNLIDGSRHTGAPGAGTVAQPRALATECFKYVQAERNRYLAVSPNGTTSMSDYDGRDPVPKATMRCAAMARQLVKPSKAPGAETDVRRGLEFIGNFLYRLEDSNEDYQNLQTKVSVRMGARGTRSSITPFEQLLLAETIFEVAVSHTAHDRTAENKTGTSRPAFTWSDGNVFFAERFASAFPGTRGIDWFSDGSDIKERLAILFGQPISFDGANPIWWWRGGSNLDIRRFDFVSGRTFLMNYDELEIARIAAVYSTQYFRSFVYVEVKGAAPTGLYPDTPIHINDVENGTSYFPYHSEQYAIVDGTHLITSNEFDDGSARIDGSLQKISGRAELRCRYVTPFNFILAAQDSPINNSKADQALEALLNGMLAGHTDLQEVVDFVGKLPKQH